MASTRRTAPTGHEPVKGFPDPAQPRRAVARVTHYPHTNGAVCNVRPAPTSASSYSLTDPTCPKCRAWFESAKEQTAQRHPEATTRKLAAESTASE